MCQIKHCPLTATMTLRFGGRDRKLCEGHGVALRRLTEPFILVAPATESSTWIKP
jgi:hypothetical protein